MDREPTDGGVRRQWRGTGLYWSLILALVVAAALIVGIIQNSQEVRLKYLAWEGNVPLIVVLLGTVVLTVALTSLVGLIWRRRRRHQLTEALELRELRAQAQSAGIAGGTEDSPGAPVVTEVPNPRASG